MTLKSVNNSSPQLSDNNHIVAANIEKKSRMQIGKMKEEFLLTPEELDERKIIYASCRNYKTLNDYRELRTKLLKISSNNNFICMISSISQDAGTTQVAINLAASIALDRSKTAVIIDCNIHDAKLNDYFKVTPRLVFTSFLELDTDDMEEIIYPSGIPRIRMIPVGIRTEHAAEYFSSEKMELFMARIKQRYPDRFIILDAPPIGLYAEGQILASLCDFAVLVVRYGQSNSEQVQAGIDIISTDKLAGLIFNN